MKWVLILQIFTAGNPDPVITKVDQHRFGSRDACAFVGAYVQTSWDMPGQHVKFTCLSGRESDS